MTLHNAIEQLLKLNGSMTTQQIADKLNFNKWYKKKDGSIIHAFQIHGRTKNYPDIFGRDGSTVFLIEGTRPKVKESMRKTTKAKQQIKKPASIHLKTSFDPVSNDGATVLILGSIPGDKSLELNEYYAHPRNRFWKIITILTNSNLPGTYSEKKELLRKSKIAIWDVAHNAIRQGSLDSAIKDEEPNDLEGFIRRHRNLKVIGFNGGKAHKLFNKYFERKRTLKYITLPSTSPANTGFDLKQLCMSWQQILT